MEQDERLAALKAEFARQQQNDKKAAALLEKIETGHAAFSDATQYSFRLGALLGRAFKAVLASDEDKACLLDPDTADALVRPILAQSASLAGNAAEQAIRTQNQAVGIGLNAQTADPQRVSDRIDGIVTSVYMQADADSALDALERESVGFTASAADEALEASGNFLASVGRSAKIVRTASANACAWCLEREGTYEYPDVPKDVFQRHANCTCTLDYYPAERSARQNAWTKMWAQEIRTDPELKNIDLVKRSTIQPATGANVLNEYERTKEPGRGKLTYDDAYNKESHADEVNMAKWLLQTYGGDIQLLSENDKEEGVKRPDYLWRGKMWDLKTVSSEKAVNSAARHGLKQIAENPGGLIFDFGSRNINWAEMTSRLERRIAASRKNKDEFDVLILSKGHLIGAFRY